ncbi:hypothetical protein BD779DRAFT_1545701, partial [Infundibulicybe gibba]
MEFAIQDNRYPQSGFGGRDESRAPAGGEDITNQPHVGSTTQSPESQIVIMDAPASGVNADLETQISSTVLEPTIPFNSPALLDGLVYEQAPTPVPAPIIILQSPRQWERQECTPLPSQYCNVASVSPSGESPGDMPTPTTRSSEIYTVAGPGLPVLGEITAPWRENLADGLVPGILTAIDANTAGLTSRLRGRANTGRDSRSECNTDMRGGWERRTDHQRWVF